MIFLIKNGNRYKVTEDQEDFGGDTGWSLDLIFQDAKDLMRYFINEAMWSDDESSWAISDYIISCIEDRQKLEFQLRQKNLS